MNTTSRDSTRALVRFDFVEEPRGDVYRALLNWIVERCQTALFVVREFDDLDESAIQILNEAEPATTSVEKTQQWPGTVLLSPGDFGTVHRYRLSPQVLKLLTTAVDGLYDWTQPARPEDLCLLRSDGAPMLVTIAHERDAYLNLTLDEAAVVGGMLPELKIKRHDVTPSRDHRR